MNEIAAAAALAAAILVIPFVALGDSPLHDAVASDWVDLGHWHWPEYKQGEVFYSPSLEGTQTYPTSGRSVTFPYVLIKIVYGYHAGESEQEFDTTPNNTVYWQYSIWCGHGEYAKSQWYMYPNQVPTDATHGPDEGPFPIAGGSVAAAAERVLCH